MIRFLVVALSLYLGVMGLLLVLVPTQGKKLADILLKDKSHRGWALFTILVGLGLLIAARQTRWSAFIAVLGVTTAIKGLYLLIAPREQLLGVVRWWDQLQPPLYRLWGAVSIVFSILIALAI